MFCKMHFFYCESHLSYILYSHDRQGRDLLPFLSIISTSNRTHVFYKLYVEVARKKLTFTQTKIEIKKF